MFGQTTPPAPPPAQEPSAAFKTRVDAAQGNERIELSLEYAHRELEYANGLYTQGDVEKGEAAVQQSLEYAKRAADTSTSTNKRLKQTEIDLRKLEHRMHDVGASLNIDDRPPLEKGVQDIEQMRANLLARMFGDKTEPKAKPQ